MMTSSETRPRQRCGQNLNVWIPDDIMAAFQAAREKSRRSKKAELQLALEEYLTRLGLLPQQRNDRD